MPNKQIAELLYENKFGNIIKADNDNVFTDTVSDCFIVLDSVVKTGLYENQILFKKPINFKVTNSSGIQAAAKEIDSIDVAFFTIGFINKIRRTICRLFTQNNTFSDIGSPHQEKVNQNYDFDKTMLPICSDRREFVNGAIQRALEFVFIHELAHIFYGHSSYVDKFNKIAAEQPLLFLMVQPETVDQIRMERLRMEIRADRQAMEIQADRYAADVTLMFAIREISRQNKYNWSYARSCSDKMLKRLEKQAIQEWVVALCVIFNIIQNLNNEIHTHPHPMIRRLAATTSGLVVWTSTHREKGNLQMDPNEFLETINDTQGMTNVAWRNAGLPKMDFPSNLEKSDFYDLIGRAVELFPKLESRFEKQHVI